ncbi:MAG: hypothetical protein GXP55_01765, partial [Deltaproteobacteria bacterium]|nr:hypothetical protein [Deltaproteobacteria bacterium]
DAAADSSTVDATTRDASRRDASLPPTDAGADTGAVDASCGGAAVDFEYRPPNVLVIFDRSCSMRRRLDDVSLFGTGPDDSRTRWFVAREAVQTLVTDFESRVYWGLMAFPDPREGCGMPVDAEVVPGPMNAAAIQTELARRAIQPFGLCGLDNTDTTTQPRQTPTADALTSAMGLPALSDPARRNFAILVTDGGVSCGVTDAQVGALAASLAAAGIPLAVVGFATGGAETSLEAIASAGGFPNPAAPPSYFVAESRADLDSIFAELSRRVVSCDLPLSSAPLDSAGVFVNANDVPLSEDMVDGFSYDAAGNVVTLHGASCDRLRSGDITRLGVSFGCPPVMCVPRAEICNGLDDDCDGVVDNACLS